MKTITEPARRLNVRAEVDVLVVGGGPSGIIAAEAAAGNGLKNRPSELLRVRS